MSSQSVNVQFPPGIDAETLINYYVQDHMSDTAWEVFMETCHDSIGADKHYEIALAKAVVNEMVNIVLREQIEREEAKKFYLW